MTNEDREQIALFRYGLISPLLNRQVASATEYLAEVCAKTHDVPYYGRKEFAPKTLQQCCAITVPAALLHLNLKNAQTKVLAVLFRLK